MERHKHENDTAVRQGPGSGRFARRDDTGARQGPGSGRFARRDDPAVRQGPGSGRFARSCRSIASQDTVRVLVAVAAGFLTFILLYYVTGFLLDEYLDRSGYYAAHEQKFVSSLQEYADQNGVTEENLHILKNWGDQQKNIFFQIYDKQKMVYQYYNRESRSLEEAASLDYLEWSTYYDLRLGERTFRVIVFGAFDYQPFNYTRVVNVLGAFAVFLLIFLIGIRRRTRYIARLRDEIEILGSGNLDYAVTVQGNDELADLAENLDLMRQALRHQMEETDRLTRDRQDIVRRLSHDLRTPLTSVALFTDLLRQGRYEDPAQQSHYLDRIRDNISRLTYLSEELLAASRQADLEQTGETAAFPETDPGPTEALAASRQADLEQTGETAAFPETDPRPTEALAASRQADSGETWNAAVPPGTGNGQASSCIPLPRIHAEAVLTETTPDAKNRKGEKPPAKSALTFEMIESTGISSEETGQEEALPAGEKNSQISTVSAGEKDSQISTVAAGEKDSHISTVSAGETIPRISPQTGGEMIFLIPALTDIAEALRLSGFLVEEDYRSDAAGDGGIPMDRPAFARVMDNISSNILRYADPARPVRICCDMTAAGTQIFFENTIAAPEDREADGSGIGLKNVEDLMGRAGGTLQIRGEGETFRLLLIYPEK